MARTVRTKVFQFSELGKKEKERAQKTIDALAKDEYDKFWDDKYYVQGIDIESIPDRDEWQKLHYDINQFEFTQAGNIFFK